ncbi:MAG: nucleotidyltransferase family protein [Candidatus Ornithomonoglobus sp.]
MLRIAEQHSIENIAYLSLSKIVDHNNETLELFEEYYNYAVLHDATQQYYLELVIDELEKKEIRHCVMKGPIIKKLYPSSDLRKSRDIDIFVDDDNTEKVRDIMEGLGFSVSYFNKADAHDIYIIDENIKIEIHRTLLSEKCPWDAECQKIVDRLIISPNYKYRYEMSLEDYYLHMIAHMARHMKYSGMGIKMVLDVWIYLRAYNNILRWDILNEHLRDCGLDKFEKNIRELCGYWFEGCKASETVERLAFYIGASGNFGTKTQEIAGEMAQNAGRSSNKNVSRIVYFFKVFFWPYKQMRERYKVLKAIPVLLPFCWIDRAYKALRFKKETVEHVIEKYDDADMEFGKEIIEFKKEIGL